MKTGIYAILLSLTLIMALSPIQVSAATPLPEKQWEAPVMPGGTIVKTESKAIYIEYDLPYDQILAWYREALKDHKDKEFNIDWAKYRDWKDQMYIEDQGAAKWHSIGISKGGGNKTTVKIVHDNWTWIMSTLFIRFAGVFIVLCVLWLLLNLNSFIMKKYFSKEEKE
jgi:hypothetical protein